MDSVFIFAASVKLERTMEDGQTKEVTEQYIVRAATCAEAENCMSEALAPYASGEFKVEGIKRLKVADVFTSTDSEAEDWFEVKQGFITLDEKTGKEKMTQQRFLLQALSLKSAIARMDKEMESTMGEWIYISAARTKYVDYIFNEL